MCNLPYDPEFKDDEYPFDNDPYHNYFDHDDDYLRDDERKYEYPDQDDAFDYYDSADDYDFDY